MAVQTIITNIQELSIYFTSDAWQVINSFIENLQEKLDQFKIVTTDQSTIFNGIQEFLQDFVSDYKENAKITFNEALSLIQDIGSPTEILQSMELPGDEALIPIQEPTQYATTEKSVSSRSISCPSCSWFNEIDSVFCDNCGRKLIIAEKKFPSKPWSWIPPEFVLSPLVAGFLTSYLIFVIGGMISLIYSYSIIVEPDLVYIPELFDKLADISTGMIIPAFVTGISLFFVTTWFFKNKILNDRYNEHLINLQKKFSLGLMLTLVALWSILVYIPISVTRDEITTLILILILVSIVFPILIYRWNQTNKPTETPYFTFLKNLRILEHYNSSNIKRYIIISSLISFLGVTLIWNQIMPYSLMNLPGITVFGLPAWIILMMSLILLSYGVLLMYYYSWASINRFIGFFPDH